MRDVVESGGAERDGVRLLLFVCTVSENGGERDGEGGGGEERV